MWAAADYARYILHIDAANRQPEALLPHRCYKAACLLCACMQAII